MTAIRCPHCGSPVRVRGRRWECGWCGDSGGLSSLRPSEKAKLLRMWGRAAGTADASRTKQGGDNPDPSDQA